jgi:hypothetical protein
MSAVAVAGIVCLQARQVNIKSVSRFDIAMNVPVTLDATGVGPTHHVEVVEIVPKYGW